MGEFSVGIITYNSEKYLDSLIDSIQKGSVQPKEIVIVDNGSTDTTLEKLAEYKGAIRVITLSENVGHSAASNRLIEECRTRFLVLQDHDTEVYDDTYMLLLERAREFSKEEIAISTTIESTSKFDQSTTYGHDLHFLLSAMVRYEYSLEEQSIAPTTCVLVDLDKVGEVRFDNEMFIYQNDFDFFYRLRLLGYKILINKEARVLHKDGTPSVSGRKGSKYSPIKVFYINRNRLIFYLKNYSAKTLFVLSPALATYEFVALAFSLRKGHIKEYFRGLNYIFNNRKDIMAKRRIVQSSRVVKDSECLGARGFGLSESTVTNRLELYIQKTMEFTYRIYFNLTKRLF